jgi:hypothetical protein
VYAFEWKVLLLYCQNKDQKKWYVNTYSRKGNETYLHFTIWQPPTFSIQKLQFGQIFHLLRRARFISSISFSSEVPWKFLVLNLSWLDNPNVESSSKKPHFLIISSVTILWHISSSKKLHLLSNIGHLIGISFSLTLAVTKVPIQPLQNWWTHFIGNFSCFGRSNQQIPQWKLSFNHSSNLLRESSQLLVSP